LKPVNEEHIDFKNSWMVKYLFNNTGCNLTKIYRFDDDSLLKDAYRCADGLSIDFSTYDSKECDLSICWTNLCVDKLNLKWNELYAKNHETTMVAKGFGNTTIILYEGLQLMAYRTGLCKQYFNSEDYEVVCFNEASVMLKK
jgi:hypothetical protein